MAGNFLTKSRHGTTFYFRRRVPIHAQATLGKQFVLKSLETSNKCLAMIRARAFAAYTDLLFQYLGMTKNKADSGAFQFDYTLKIDLNDFGNLASITVEAQPEEQEAVNAAIKTVLERVGSASPVVTPARPNSAKSFARAIDEYYEKAQAKPSTKQTYRSKLNHAMEYFGADADALQIDQGKFTEYCEHVLETVSHPTTQGNYMSTVAHFLTWHRQRAGLPMLSTKTLLPRKLTPDSDDRDAFTLEQLKLVFQNACRYRAKSPCKFWVSIAPALLGCRIEELCQINLKTDLLHDADTDIWYLQLDGKPDPDGTVRKSMKKPSSWRQVPIHSALVRHGFIDFLQLQAKLGYQRPFQREWKPHEAKSKLGQIVKWSHAVTKWGGRELRAIAKEHGIEIGRLSFFHSMRHTFKGTLSAAGVNTDISEALAGRRYAGADAERYDKLKQNHQRLSSEGVEKGLGAIVAALDACLDQSQSA